MLEEEKVIDVRNKSDEEVLEIYKEVARETEIQNNIYDMLPDKKVASKIYNLYKTKNNVKN